MPHESAGVPGPCVRYHYVDEGIPVDDVYLEFQKAFDKVSHSNLQDMESMMEW